MVNCTTEILENEALTNYKEYSPEDLLRMSQGRAPLALNPNNGKMYPMELHHPNGRSGDNFLILSELLLGNMTF